MLRYAVRSRQIIDLVNEIRRNTLILSPYFQRNLVWRETHKQDFIDTILRGYPFPQIFISKGTIDVGSMISTSCIVDGQQRMNSILEFLDGKISIGGKKFTDLSVPEREEFLKYEVAVIDLDLRDDDPQIVEIFKRLNRTFYALSTIEKFSTEYASSEFMLVAKFLSAEILREIDNEEATSRGRDPNITEQFKEWSKNKKVKIFQEMLLDGRIFSPYETSRMVHLMYTLNLIATQVFGFYNRNDKAKDSLDTYEESFSMKDDIVDKFERAGIIFNRMKFGRDSMWINKANWFSLFSLIAKHIGNSEAEGSKALKERLILFEQDIPAAYQLAAKEGVNNRREREVRNAWLLHALFGYARPD